ncbi:MAG: hypothetical protein RIT81_40690 [Deltaproteobacteria bacterium]
MELRQVEYATFVEWPSVPVTELDADVRAKLDRFADHQRSGADYVGNSVDFTRRYVLDEGRTLYFPELLRPMTAATAVPLALGIAGLCALIAGLSIDTKDFAYAPYLAAGGVAAMVAAFFALGRAGADDAARRATVEDIGLYLFDDVIVLRHPERVGVIPRARVTRAVRVKELNDTRSTRDTCLEVVDGDRRVHVRVGGTQELVDVINAWLGVDGRP